MSLTGRTASRRRFLARSSTAIAATSVFSALAPSVYAAEDNTIKVALVGCGGRGTGAAANALSTPGPVKLIAVADVFSDRLSSSLQTLKGQFKDKVDVPKERQFIGFDGYRKAVDLLGKKDVILLTTPPAFRPIHLEYAVLKGVNVFMEKSFAVDPPGVRRVIRAGQVAAEKGLKIAGGLMWRHDTAREEMMKRIHGGVIGDVVFSRCYRMHGPVGFGNRREGESEFAHQIRNYNSFTWCNGSFIVDWLCHDIDVCCWAHNGFPVSAQGQGGRQVRAIPDQQFDHHSVEYTFADGTKLFVQGRHIDNCYNVFSEFVHCARGSAAVWNSVSTDPPPCIYRNQSMTKANEIWRHPGPACDYYQREHDLLFDAIRNDRPYNETDRCSKAILTAIMGRMAAESGQLITADQALACDIELAPGLENITSLEGPAPVNPDSTGKYPIAMPGITKAL